MRTIELRGQQENKEEYQKHITSINEAINDWQISKWAQDLSAMLPVCEFEMHIERWFDGIDSILYSLAHGSVYRSPFGRYNDFTAHTLNEAELRALALEKWLNNEQPKGNLDNTVFSVLGECNPHKRQAAQALMEILRNFVDDNFNKALSEKWRSMSDDNPLLQKLLHGEGMDRGIHDGGSYWLIRKFDLFIDIIAGRDYDETDVAASCNVTLRHVFRDDPKRVHTAKGYMIGLWAYIEGKELTDIRQACPELAGYAIKAYKLVRESKYDKTEVILISRKLFCTIRYWYIRALNFAIKDELCAEDYLLPELS